MCIARGRLAAIISGIIVRRHSQASRRGSQGSNSRGMVREGRSRGRGRQGTFRFEIRRPDAARNRAVEPASVECIHSPFGGARARQAGGGRGR